ncbi:MAG TPA: glycosyltransferase family 1 protein [Planctomycetia bacterium]|nr:glycosyltransferase family 1 protein [Planctomycetia bacterium]
MKPVALFVTNRNSLSDNPGGQQLCTREYVAVARVAGFDVVSLTFDFDRRPATRLRRKLAPRPYRNMLPPDLADRIASEAKSHGASAVLLNLVELTPLAEELKRRLDSGVSLALLSHGAESVDYLHTLRIGSLLAGGRAPRIRQRLNLADQLLSEASFRPHFDRVFTLAPFEAEIERWLGARAVTWLPRLIPAQPLDWRPVEGRLGLVGTLDHPPTQEGLALVLPEIEARAPAGLRLRLVGGPKALGEAYRRDYPFIEYLGYIDDAALAAEAATWTVFLHPLFCYARGASTKLATGLGWMIPVLATAAGCRGYQWREGGPMLVETAAEFAAAALALGSDANLRNDARRAVAAAAASAPTAEEVAALFRAALAGAESPS